VSEATIPLQPSVAQGISGHLSAGDTPEAMQQDPPQVAPHEAPTEDMAAAGGVPTPSEPPSTEAATAVTSAGDQQDSSAVRCEEGDISQNVRTDCRGWARAMC